MPQLRVTKKLAKDLHVTILQEPQETASIFDDWVVDVICVQRKKVAMVTHVKSYLPFFIPYQTIGGAKNISSALGMCYCRSGLFNMGRLIVARLLANYLQNPSRFVKQWIVKY